MTTAEKIAAQYLNADGFGDNEGINGECSNNFGCRVYDTSRSVYRWDFRDGSCLMMVGGTWDIGYPTCYCQRAAGHTDDCVAQMREE